MATTSNTTPEDSKGFSEINDGSQPPGTDAKGLGEEVAKEIGGGERGLSELSTNPIVRPVKSDDWDKPEQFQDKANEILSLLEGRSKQEIDAVFEIIALMLPSRVRIHNYQ